MAAGPQVGQGLPQLPLPHHDLQTPVPAPNDIPNTTLSQKQKWDLLKANFHKTQHDAQELFKLAQSLQADLNKSNAGVLSLKIVEKAGKIEKLAKKIKNESRGY